MKNWMEAVRGFVQRVLGKNFPSPEVAAAVQAGTITGPYRPEEFSAFSLARRRIEDALAKRRSEP